MSFSKALSLVISLGLFLTACQKSDSETTAVDKSGNCKQEAIDAYNTVLRKKSSYYATELESSCQKYKTLIGSQSCKAINTFSGVTTEISATSLDDVCVKSSTPQTSVPTPTPAPTTTPDRGYESTRYCSYRVISYYNDLITASQKMLSEKSPASVDIFLNACKNFKEEIKEKVCIATSSSTYTTITLAYSDFKAACEQNLSPTPDTSNELASLPKGVTLLVLKAERMNLLLQKNALIKAGKILTKTKNEVASCKVLSRNPKFKFQNGQKIVFSRIENIKNKTILESDIADISIACTREDFSKGTTLRELENIFGNLIDTQINQ